jgi:hypothetical protein
MRMEACPAGLHASTTLLCLLAHTLRLGIVLA